MPAEPVGPRPRTTIDLVLVGILAAAAVLRVWGLGYGLPHVYNPDEVSILSRALSMAGKHLNPGNFVYPSLFLYVLAAATGAWYAALHLIGSASSLAAFQQAFWQDPTGVYLVARSVSAAAGVASVGATYALARPIGSRAMARSAACLMAVAYFPVRDAHMVKHDVFMALMAVVVVLAARRIWTRGTTGDYLRAGALSGLSFALHYYAGLTFIPIIAAHLLRRGSLVPALRDRRIWMAAAAFALLFAAGSPYVLIDFATAIRDISSNNQVLFARTQPKYGTLGSGWYQAQLMWSQGAGAAMTLAAAGGLAWICRRSWREAAWLFSFPAAFSLMLLHTWPYGRLQNVLYPFVAVAAAAAIDRVAAMWPRRALGAAALTAACALQPAWYDATLDRLFTRPDTRTEAAIWIENHVPAGKGIAAQVYSVPLEPTREWLLAALARDPAGDAGPRARGLLARSPYPAAAYRLFYLGVGGRDKDKIYLDPDDVFGANGFETLARNGVSYIVIKQTAPDDGSDGLRRALARGATLVFRASPFAPGVEETVAQLPDYDIRPSDNVLQPGPIIEVWQVKGSAAADAR